MRTARAIDMATLFFSPVGTINRELFTLGWLFWLSAELAGLFGMNGAAPHSTAAALWLFALIAVSTASLVSGLVMGIKRLRDAGQPVFLALALLVPVISIGVLVLLSVLPSRQR